MKKLLIALMILLFCVPVWAEDYEYYLVKMPKGVAETGDPYMSLNLNDATPVPVGEMPIAILMNVGYDFSGNSEAGNGIISTISGKYKLGDNHYLVTALGYDFLQESNIATIAAAEGETQITSAALGYRYQPGPMFFEFQLGAVKEDKIADSETPSTIAAGNVKLGYSIGLGGMDGVKISPFLIVNQAYERDIRGQIGIEFEYGFLTK